VNEFCPYVGLFIPIGPTFFRFLPHPYFSDDEQEVFVVEGGEALLYKVENLAKKTFYALKVLKPSYRSPRIAEMSQILSAYRDLPGLYLTQRICLTQDQFPELISRFPNLEYALLMPWIEGKTWAGLMLDQAASARYSYAVARKLDMAVAHVLWKLEASGLAHTDIAGGNVILSPSLNSIQLLDIEGLYTPKVTPPQQRSYGSPGYQHRALDERGQWRAEGDRFAGAMLLTEMLTWCDPSVRAQTPLGAETLFHPLELQTEETPRVQTIRKSLWAISPTLLELFDQAWISPELAQCADLKAWARCLGETFR